MTRLRALPTTLWRKATELWRTLWVRVVLMGALALAVIGLSQIGRASCRERVSSPV